MSVINREAVLDAIDKNRQDLLSLGMDGAEHILVRYGRRVIENLPADENDEWCDNCKEYDHNKRCCSRFNRVIRETVEEVKQNAEQQWIPIKTRPMDEEERAEWSEKLGYDIEYEDAVIYTSQLPNDRQEVLTCSRYGTVRIDRFENDPDYGCSFEENGDMDGIVAWMPLPEPYQKEGD